MKTSDLYAGMVVLLISLVLLGLSFGIHEDIVPGDTLGSRFFPRIIVILLAVCSLFIMYDGVKARKLEAEHKLSPKARDGVPTRLRAALTIGFSFLYVFWVMRIGFVISTPVLLFGLLLAWGVKNKLILILIPLLTTAFLYVTFVYAFEIMLPRGILG